LESNQGLSSANSIPEVEGMSAKRSVVFSRFSFFSPNQPKYLKFRIWALRLSMAVCVMAGSTASNALAGQVSLAWDPCTESDVAGYRIYYGVTSGSYSVNIDVHNVTAYTVTGLNAEQTYYFAATVYDSAGNESGYSNEVHTTIPSIKTLPWLQLLLQDED
jgi:hypothetical protein